MNIESRLNRFAKALEPDEKKFLVTQIENFRLRMKKVLEDLEDGKETEFYDIAVFDELKKFEKKYEVQLQKYFPK